MGREYLSTIDAADTIRLASSIARASAHQHSVRYKEWLDASDKAQAMRLISDRISLGHSEARGTHIQSSVRVAIRASAVFATRLLQSNEYLAFAAAPSAPSIIDRMACRSVRLASKLAW